MIKSLKNITCNAGTDGEAEFTVSGNTAASYSYTFVDNASVAVAGTRVGDVITYTGLKAGIAYTFTVTNDDTKCSATRIVTLTEPTAITALAANASKVYCDKLETTIKVTATGGVSPLQYAVVKLGVTPLASDYNTTGSFVKDTNADGLVYDVYVKDKNGNCPQKLAPSLTVVKDNGPTINPVTAPQCYSGSNFTVSIVGTTYNSATLYGLDGNYNTNPVKTITGPGTYVLGVKDDNGCEVTTSFVVNKLLTIKANLDKDITCFAPAAAQITLSATGGNATYTYAYRVGTTGTYSALPAVPGNVLNPTLPGDYYFRVTSGGCSIETTAPVKVTAKVDPEITGLTQTQFINCNANETAAINIAIDNTKGLAPFVFNVKRYADNTYTLPFVKDYGTQTTSLAAGYYRVTVTDAKGCTDTEDIFIDQPTPVSYTYSKNEIICSGSGTTLGSIIATPTGGSGTYSYVITNNVGATVSPPTISGGVYTFNIVNFGIYELTFADANGCSHKEIITMASPPNDLKIDVTTGPVSCTSATVQVTVNPLVIGGPYYFALFPIISGSTPPYDYATNTGSYQSADAGTPLTSTFNGLNPGVIYSFIVYDDATKCYYFKQAESPTLTSSTLVSSTPVPHNVKCKGAADGTVDFSFTNTYPVATDVTYQIFNSQTNLATSLPIGTIPGLTGTVTTPVTGVGPLAPGTYYILFKEASAGANNGCTNASTTFTITESAFDLSVSASVFKNENCIEPGIITAQGRDGTAPYEYLINTTNSTTAGTPSAWQSSNTFGNLVANIVGESYHVFIRDANGCIKPATPVTLVKDPDPVFTLAVPNLCAAEGAFVVNVTITEPTLPLPPMAAYSISVNGGGFQSVTGLTFAATGLNSGEQTIIIQNKNGCPTEHKIIINATPTAKAVVSKVLDCSVTGSAVANATITVTISDGTKGFTYQAYKNGTPVGGPVTLPVADNTFSYSVAEADYGTYKFEITDANSCSVETNDVIIDPIVPIAVVPDLTQPLCNGDSNGAIEFPATGGKGKYIFTLQKTSSVPVGSVITQNTPLFNSLSAGGYAFTITDELGCTLAGTVTLGEPTALGLGALPVITPLTCGPNNIGQDAEVDLALTGTGGTGSYLFSFKGSTFSTQTKYFVIDTQADQLNIPYAIQDANGCEVSGTIDILKLNPPTDFDITAARTITCNDVDTDVTISNVENALGPITSGLTYQLISSTSLSPIRDNVTNATFSALLPGDYVFQVTDAHGCVKQLSFEIKKAIEINLTEQSTTGISCIGTNDGKASFLVGNFNPLTSTYHYIVDALPTVSAQTAATINLTGLSSGNHLITIYDDTTGCSFPLTFNIAEPLAPLTLDPLVVTPLGCTTDGAVTITAQGGWGDYTYTITKRAPLVGVLTNKTGVFGGLTEAGNYDIVVKDANGCEVNDTFELFTPINPVATIAASDYCYDNVNLATLVVTASSTSPFIVAGDLYEYSIDNGQSWQSSNTFPNLTPNTYDVKVKDKFGCISPAQTTTINTQLFASALNTKEIFCTGTVDGTITISAQGGYGDYTYTVTKDTDPTSAPIAFGTGLDTAQYTVTAPGSYKFVVYDARNCSYTIVNSIVMDSPDVVTFTAVPTSPSCVGTQGELSDGSILVTLGANNDNPDYKYTIVRTSPTGYTSTQDNNGLFTGLTSGTYDVTVSSARDCSFTDTIVILDPNPVLAAASATPFTCSGNVINETVVTVTGSGGAGTAGNVLDYTYSQDGTSWDTKNTFNVSDNNATQTLTYYVRDAKGCIDDVTISIASFPKLSLPTVTFGPLFDCLNNKQEINVVINGGTNTPNPFTYNVYRDGVLITAAPVTVTGNTFIYDALTVGSTYEFEILDNNTGCSIKSAPQEVPVFNIAKVTASASAMVSCNGGSNGAIEINIADYSGAYTYEVFNGTNPVAVYSNSGNTSTNPFVIPFTLVAGNNYRVVVTETAYPSCTIISNDVAITEPPVLDITNMNVAVINQNCNRPNGAVITVDASTIVGGAPGGYMYAFVATTTPPTIPAAGDYIVSNTKTIVTAQIAPLFDSYDVYVKDSNGCYAFKTVNISLDPLPAITNVDVASQCFSTAGYRIDVTANGVGPLQYSLDGVQYQDDAFFTVTDPGNYTVSVKDKNQCVTTATAPVVVLEPLRLRGEVSLVPVCTNPNGEITLYASGGTVSTPSSYLYTIDNWASSQSSNVFNGLAPGTYNFKVRDIVEGCEKDAEVIISTPTLVTGITLTPTPVTCNGGSNGTISVALDPSNNNPKYTYALTGVDYLLNPVTRPSQDAAIFENLPAGTYTVTVTSGRGCFNSATIDVIQPAVIAVSLPVVSQFACTTGTNGTNMATITVNTVTGGSNSYAVYEFINDLGTVVQRGPSNVYTELNLAGGSYVVNVYDDKGCMGSSTATIDPFIGLGDITLTINNEITCTSSEDLTVSVATTGGTPTSLLYSVVGISGTVYSSVNQPTGVFTGLGIGTYRITATNPITGCSVEKIHYVNNPNTFELKVTPISTQICYGTSAGSVDLTFVDTLLNPNDDAGIFDYTITGPVPSSGRTTTAGPITISNLTAGQYTVTATLVNKPSCTISTVFSIAQPSRELLVTTTQSEITCISGNNDGTITASASGGWPITAYQYDLVLNGTVIAQNNDGNFTGLSAGTYTINAKDGKDCVASATAILVVPAPIVVTASANATMLSCFGDKNGIITVNPPTGGQGSNYMYTLNIVSATPVIASGPQSTPVFTDLGAGTYNITVTDGFNCAATSTDIVITQPTEVKPTLVLSRRLTCLTQSELTLASTGGTAPYYYSTDANFTTIIGSFTTDVTFAVPVGIYQYYVRDANGCVGFITNEIANAALEPLNVKVDVTNAVVKCLGEATGVIIAEANGGLGNYTYTLQDTAGNDLQGPQISGTFEGLIIGSYVVKVDSGDCNANSATVTITQPATALQAQFIPTNVSCFGENNGKIEVIASGGTGTIKYAISPDLNQFDFKTVFEKLAPGRYTIIAQDQNGCYVMQEVEITQPNPLIATMVPNSMRPELCAGDKDGEFSIQVVGGTAPYSVSLDNKTGTYTQGVVGQTVFPFTGLSGGKHVVYVKDSATNCSTEVEVIMPEPVVLNPIVEINYDCVNNASANFVKVIVDKSNTDPSLIKYEIDGLASTNQASNIFLNVTPGPHIVTAIHNNGCFQSSAEFTIKTVDPLTIGLSAGTPEMNVISVTASGGNAPYEYSFEDEAFSSNNKFKIYKTAVYKIVVRDANGCTAEILVPMTYVDVCIPTHFTPNGDNEGDEWGPGCTNIYDNLLFDIYDRYGRVVAKYHYGQKWDGKYNGEELPSGDYWYVLKLNDEKDAREFVGHFTLYR